jgi:membrane protein implicated in regulation of membrane protease activity
MWQIWLIAAGVFFIGEIITVGFLIFWLGIGALLAMIVSFFTSNLIIQTAVFVISSTILMFATKPFVNKITKNDKKVSTNVYSIIGKKGIVTQDINIVEGKGQIKVNGELWSAICNGNITISAGTEVEVKEVRGVKALVEPINSTINV